MRIAQRLRLFPRNSRTAAARAACRNTIEALESRTLLNAALTSAITPVSVSPGTPATVALTSHFNDASVTGTAVLIKTTEGDIPISLFDSQVGTTVQNFLHYVNSGEYNGTFIHRVVTVGGGGIGIVQGGGYTPDQNHIATTSPIPLQYGIPNSTGTIAMARTQVQNSATSEWFFNAADNSSTLGQGNGGGYAVFGQVIYGGMQAVNAIYGLQLANYPPNFASNPPSVPVINYSGGTVQPSNLVILNSAAVVQPLSFTATSDNPSLIAASVSGGNLTLTSGATAGTANITVTATDLGGNVATATFAVTATVQQVTIGKGAAARIVHFTDPDGTAGQVTIQGAGTATLQFNGSGISVSTSKSGIATVSGTPTSVVLSTTGTDASTVVTITGKGGNGVVDLAGIGVDGATRAINGRNTALTGNLQASGSVGALTLASASNGILGIGSGAAVSLNIGSGRNAALTSASAIKSLNAGSWDAGGHVAAPSIGMANVKGAFAADVTTGSVGTFRAGSITGGTWNVSGNAANVAIRSASGWTANFGTLGHLAVAGAFDNSVVRSSGNIISVAAASITGSSVFAGVAGTTLPASSGDFNNSATITSFHVARDFLGSNVAAANLGNVSAGTIQLSNGGTPFGFAAHTIKSFNAIAGAKRLHLANVTSESQVTSALTALGIVAQDFVIRIV